MFGTSWRVGRVAGVEVRVDSSWAVIALLVTYSMYLRSSILYPELSGVGALALAILATLLFFGSVLVHELAHHLVDDLDPLYVDERGVRARSVAEVRANAFAAHLLMPEPGVRTAIEGTADDAERAVRVALAFGTSVSAAAYQLGNLGLLPATVRDRLAETGAKPLLMRYALPSDWQQDERGRGQVRPPGRLYGRATLAFRRGLIGLEPIVDLLQRSDRDQLRQELDDAGLAPDEDAFGTAGPAALDEFLEEMAPGR